MRFYYNDIGYNCTWSNKIKGYDTWWSMEPAKIKVRLPLSVYKQIILDINLRNEEIRESKSNQCESVINFKIHKEKGEKVEWLTYSTDESELWEYTAILDRLSYTSKFNDNTIMVIIDCCIQYHDRLNKSELRELLLNEIV